MNDFDFPYPPKNETYMTDDERKSHKKIFSKLGFAFLTYLLVSQVFSILAGYIFGTFAPHLLSSAEFVLALSSGIQYLVAFPIFYLCLRQIPKHEPTSTHVGTKRLLKYLVVCMLFMYVGNYISMFIMERVYLLLGRVPENSINVILDETNILVSALIVGIIGPIFEELIFRKLFIDRLTPYGDITAILLPSLIFGLFHGNLYQFFYAFFIGVVLSYIYIKTGKIWYSIGLHIFINMFCGIFPSIVFSMIDYEELTGVISSGALTEEYISANLLPIILFLIYSYGMIFMVGVGAFVLFRNIKNIRINKSNPRFPKGTAADTIFFNVGIISVITISIIFIALNTFG